jgi:hypothetical protein
MLVLLRISDIQEIPWEFVSRDDFLAWFHWAMSLKGVLSGNYTVINGSPVAHVTIDDCPRACPILFLPTSQ